MTRVLVTPRSLTAAAPAFPVELQPLFDAGFEVVFGPAGRVPNEAELLELVDGVDGWLAGVERIGAPVLAAASNLKLISRNGVGADNIDAAEAELLGVEIVLARGSNSRGVAELAFTLGLSCLRAVPEANSAMHAGRWQRRLGRELHDCTVGIVGFGAIGGLVAGFATVFGATVVAFDPYAEVTAESGVKQVELDELFSLSDVVSLHSPPSGQPIVTAGRLATLPSGAVLVNTARSALVDSDAVLAALTSGQLSWYAVDAFDVEPPEPSPLLAHPHTIMTPHLGGYTAASVRRATQQAVSVIVDRLSRST